MVVSVGVNVTVWLAVPALGVVDGMVKAKLPGTTVPAALVTTPPLKIEAPNIWP